MRENAEEKRDNKKAAYDYSQMRSVYPVPHLNLPDII